MGYRWRVNDNPRISYQRRLQQRQTVIFGSIAIVLALLMLVSMLWFSGVLPSPFSREFSSRPDDAQSNVVPCLPEGTPSVEYSTITVNVYNASNRTGLASSISGQLIEQGITVSEQENWGGAEPGSPVVIYSSQNALGQAYTVARMFPSAVILLDGTTETEVLDIVLGQSFGEMKPQEELAQLGPGQELTSPEDCVVVDR